jgi:hypothetical protein
MVKTNPRLILAGLLATGCAPVPVASPAAAPAAGVDPGRAAALFDEAAALCAREGGRHWGTSLCGPIVIADPVTKSIATNQPAPSAPRPAALGYANAAMKWGDIRWTTLVWQHVAAADDAARRILLVHELFHRVQPELGLMLPEPANDHLDALAGRYWLQLEWRALGRALESSEIARTAALRDALAFRAARHREFPAAAENERILLINEGLAQYTGTVATFPEPREAAASVVGQLAKSAESGTFVRTFAYGSGAAYGVLLDAWSPGWTRALKSTDDPVSILAAAAAIPEDAGTDAAAAAARYGGAELRVAEERRDAEQKARVAAFRRRFVDGPVLSLPRGRSASFVTSGMTPIPGAGTIFPTYRTTTDWGSLEAEFVLVAADNTSLRLPAPVRTDGATLRGEGWTVQLAEGWGVQPGARAGDFEVVRR